MPMVLDEVDERPPNAPGAPTGPSARGVGELPLRRARLLPVESLVYEAEHDGVRGVHEMTAFDPLDLGRGHGLGHEVRHVRERRRRVLAGDD